MHESTKTPIPPPPTLGQGGDSRGIVGDWIQNHAQEGEALKVFSKFSWGFGTAL